MIDQIEVTFETTISEYVAFAACALSVIDLVSFCVACKCILRAGNRRFTELPQQSFPVHVTPASSFLSNQDLQAVLQTCQETSVEGQRQVPHK